MNTISRVAQRVRQPRTPLVLVGVLLLIIGTHGCTFIGPISLGCEEISVTVTPGTCTAFQTPQCFNAFPDEGAVIDTTSPYDVIGDEQIGFQFCAAEGAPSTSSPEAVPYLISAGPGRSGQGVFLVTVEGFIDATVSDSPDPVTAGSDLTYTVTLTNMRPASVSFIDLIDRLPGSVTLVSSLPAGCALADDEIVCHEISITGGASLTYQFVVRPTTPGEIVNELRVFDPFLSSPVTITNTTTVNPANGADLAVTITDNPDPVIRGAAVGYTITVTNHGPATATGVRLSDLLPPMEVFSIVPSQGSFTRPTNSQILCDFGTIASGATATLTVVGATGVTGANINTATVTANEADPNTANNTATETTTVNPP